MVKLNVAIVVSLFLQAIAFSAPADTGQLPWVVYRCNLHDFNVKDKIIADFSSETEAAEFARQRIASDKDGFTYVAAKRPSETGVSVPIENNQVPKATPKFIDPGAYKSFRSDINLEGKFGTGKVGTYEVIVEFRKDSKFSFTSGLSGEGKWTATSNGGILLETARSNFRGGINGDTISGYRFIKDGSEPMVEFSLTLQPFVSVVGTWQPDNAGLDRAVYSADGTGYEIQKDSGNRGITWTWQQYGNTINVNYKTFYGRHNTTLGGPAAHKIVNGNLMLFGKYQYSREK